MTGALSDLRVLDLSIDVAGPFCGKLLGDFGADVIKVEPPGGDPGRDLPPFVDDVSGPERSGFFAYLNSNKRGVTLNLGSTRGQALLRALARHADIVVESFAPGYLDERRAGFDLLEAAKPGIIVTSITPFGQTGPWAGREGNDLTAYALSGWASINGVAGKAPLKGSGYQASFLGGIAGFFGTLSALIYRERNGVGQQVDVSVLEALTEIFGPRFLGAQHAGEGTGDGRREKLDFMSGPVECKDGHFSLTLSRAHFWRDAMNTLGLRELAQSEQFFDRVRQRDELSALIEPKIAEWDKQDLFGTLSALRVVSGMVLTTEELFANPHVRDRGFFVAADQPGLGGVEMPGAPFKMGATPWALRRPAPRLGEHTEEVLAEALGLSAGDVEDLRRDGDL